MTLNLQREMKINFFITSPPTVCLLFYLLVACLDQLCMCGCEKILIASLRTPGRGDNQDTTSLPS
jgi:hypothetical protein